MADWRSSARMIGFVRLDQACPIDFGVELGRRQAGVPQQFLDLPQIGPRRQKMGGKRMPQGMRRRRLRQPQSGAHALHGELDEAWIERPTLGTTEYRLVNRLYRDGEFVEGVRALLIDKDKAPRWSPATSAEVTPAMVESYFFSLGAEELPLAAARHG